MKNIIILYSAIAICFALISGCKDDSSTNPIDNDKPLVTLVGTPTGPAVTASIDANGGTLSSADGMLQLIVPAGAVNSATVFSIQAVSNQCPGGFGIGYRLLPEGTTFAQPVTLNFSYDDTLLANEKFLGIAYQGTDKTWFAPKVVSLNAGDNKFSVQTKHFSDWTLYQKIAIEPSFKIVKVSESLDLEVILIGEPKFITDSDGNEIYNLNISKTYVSTWEVNGSSSNTAPGGHVVKKSEDKGTYKAPSVVPSQNPVVVSATLKNVSFTLNGVTFNNPKVTSKIRIIGKGTLFSVEFTSNRAIQPVGNNSFRESDRGRMSVLILEDESVMVFDLYNEDAKLTPESLSDEGCTYTVSNPGDGIFNFSPGVSFVGEYSPMYHLISVGINGTKYSMGYTPSFLETCTGGSTKTIDGYEQVAAPTGLNIDTNKDYQESVETIPYGGLFPDGFIKIAITKVK